MEQRRQSSQLQSRLTSRRTSGPGEKLWVPLKRSAGKNGVGTKPGTKHINIPVRSPGASPRSELSTPHSVVSRTPGSARTPASPNTTASKRPQGEKLSPSPSKHSTQNGGQRKASQPHVVTELKDPAGARVKISKFITATKAAPGLYQDNNPFSNEKPYPAKKRAVVCNLVRSIIQSDVVGRVSLPSDRKSVGQGLKQLLGPGQMPKEAKETSHEPKSESSTPRNSVASKLFSTRKQSHDNINTNGSGLKRENGKLKIKNITVKRAPSIVLPEPGKVVVLEKPPGIGSRRSSKEPESENEGKKAAPEKAQKGMVVCTGSTSEYSTTSGSFVKFNDAIGQEREKIVQYNKLYFSKNNDIPETTLEHYKFVKLIGKGAFGKVSLGIHKLTGKYVAIKTIDKEHLKDEFSKRKVLREIYILKKIKHVNVIRLLEVFESPKQVLMVMEYAGGGDLLHYVKRKKYLTEEEAKPIFRQIVYGLAHIHSRNVLHRDIKLDNILLDSEGGVKICDFGVSKIIDKRKVINDQCGTPAYIAPEIITNLGYKGFYVDHWSLGVLLYAMLCGTVPFKAPNMKELHELIKEGEFTYPLELSEGAKSLINGLLKVNPRERLSLPEILAHPWLEQHDTCDSNDEYNYYIVRNDKVLDESSDAPPTINNLCIENLFFPTKQHVKLSFRDYCFIANDFYTHHIDEEAAKIVETYGYPKEFVMNSLTHGEINHATASYNLLELGQL